MWRIGKTNLASIFERILVISLAVCLCGVVYAMLPPPPKPLSDRVKLASHIFVGTAKELWVTDEKGKRVTPEPESLKLDQGAWVAVEVNEVLRPESWSAKTNVLVQLPPGLFSVRQLRGELVGKKLIYLTKTNGATFGASYGWNLTEPFDKKSEIETIIKNQLK